MYLCYIDESGNTGQNLGDIHQPTLVLTALFVPSYHVKAIEEEVRVLGQQYFGAESRNTDFELHGDDIYNARGRYFKKLPLSRRIEILDKAMQILLMHDQVQYGYVCIRKASYSAKEHIQQTAFSIMVENVEEQLKLKKSYGLLIADEQDEVEQRLIDDLDYFKQHGTLFVRKNITISRIVDSVHFVKSNNNRVMQLADVVCYLVRRGIDTCEALKQEYKASPANLGDNISNFDAWCNQHAHRGKRYFYKTGKLLKTKGLLFSENYP